MNPTPAILAAKHEAYERAKEEAAKLCEDRDFQRRLNPRSNWAALDAAAIRALHNPYPKESA